MEGIKPTILWVALWGQLYEPLDLGNGQDLLYREVWPGFYRFCHGSTTGGGLAQFPELRLYAVNFGVHNHKVT